MLPKIPPYSTNNAHMFYLISRSQREREGLSEYLKANGIQAATHYLSLRTSMYYRDKSWGPEPVNCERFVNGLLRLPLFYALEQDEVLMIVDKIEAFYAGL